MEPSLSLKNVSVSYGNLKALEDVSFEIEEYINGEKDAF